MLSSPIAYPAQRRQEILGTMRFVASLSIVLLSMHTRVTESANLRAKAEKYYCNGECNVVRTNCSCEVDCRELRKCCTDYTESCEGGQSWTAEPCTPNEEMVCPPGYEKTVLILSIDGFRDIYFQRNLTPTISKLMECGVSAPYMLPTYPTKTFPNHYTIATGLYPESHGIIANKMYNHHTEEEFRVGRSSSYNPDWWKGEPIWVTASNAGLLSGAFFWPGTDVNITRYPDYWTKYDESIDAEERAYTMLSWMDKNENERPKMMVMYTPIVDQAGHTAGPFSELVNTSLADTDKFIEMIMNGLRDRELDTCVNFVLVSDHGMADIDCTNDVTYLDDYGVNISTVYMDTGPYARIGKSADKALWEKFDSVETKKKLECKRDETHWEAFLKYEYLPKRYHYANNPWIEDLHLVMDPEWWVDGTAADGPGCSRGNHGYDELYEDMKSIFVAHGPDLKRGYKKGEAFESIEVYNLLTDLLNITGANNNGTRGALYDVMASSPAVIKEDVGQNSESCPASDDNLENLNCPGCEGVSDDEANNRLKSYESQATTLEKKHMPYGRPRVFDSEASYCLLYQNDFVTTYDKTLRMPRIVSFVLDQTSSWGDTPSCVRRDIRLPNEAITKCSDYDNNANNVSWSFMFFPNLSSDEVYSDATVTSNMVPIREGFKQVWKYMQKMMDRWASMYNGISVHVGPIFDYNFDGIADDGELRQRDGEFIDSSKQTAIPTHFFVVMTRCRAGKSIAECANDVENIDVLSFIIPNYAEEPCHKDGEQVDDWVPRSLARHVARIKDIELLTKSSFLTQWVTQQTDSDEIHLEALRKKLYVPKQSSSWLNDFIVNPTTSTLTTTSGTIALRFNTITATYLISIILMSVSYIFA